MAMFEKVTVVDSRGKEHVVEAGPLSGIQVKQGEQTLCVEKEDVFGFRKETTCIQNPRLSLNGGR